MKYSCANPNVQQKKDLEYLDMENRTFGHVKYEDCVIAFGKKQLEIEKLNALTRNLIVLQKTKCSDQK